VPFRSVPDANVEEVDSNQNVVPRGEVDVGGSHSCPVEVEVFWPGPGDGWVNVED
jgi:hypothetical protein